MGCFQGLESLCSLLQLPRVSSSPARLNQTNSYDRTFASVYSFSLFLPTIIRDLGHANEKAQLMTVPPYVVACFFCILTGYLADRLQTRGIVMIAYNFIGIIGLIMLVASSSPEVKYAGTFFFATGVYPNVPQCMVSQYTTACGVDC